MRTTYFAMMRSVVLTAVVVTALGTVFANAQSGAASARKDNKPTVTTLANRTLLRTTFQANDSNVAATCGSSGCLTSTAVFTKGVQCPLPRGKSCTLYIHLESQDIVTVNDNGLFKFLVDGVAPSPGATDSNGFFRWVLNDPDSGTINFEARSYAVVAKVINTSDNQSHSVEVDIACSDTNGDGCSASMGLASLSIAEYKP